MLSRRELVRKRLSKRGYTADEIRALYIQSINESTELEDVLQSEANERKGIVFRRRGFYDYLRKYRKHYTAMKIIKRRNWGVYAKLQRENGTLYDY